MSRLWDRFLTDRDKEVFATAGLGVEAGFLDRPALLVIDITQAFVGDRREEVRESAKRFHNSCGADGWDAMERLVPLLDRFRAKGLPVIYTRAEMEHPWLDAQAWGSKNTRTMEGHSSAHRDDNEIPAMIAPKPGDIVVEKTKPSAFFASVTAEYLVRLGVNQVLCCGTSTSGCVRASVVDAFSLGYRTAVIEDCTFDRGEASHAIALFDMGQKYADVVSSERVHDYLAAFDDATSPPRWRVEEPA